jgi:hypothetical protein
MSRRCADVSLNGFVVRDHGRDTEAILTLEGSTGHNV